MTKIARVRQKEVKEASKRILARYWSIIEDIWNKSERIKNVDDKKAASYRFEMYKDLVGSVLQSNSKTMRNRIAGYLITLVKQVKYLRRINISELRAKYGMRAVEKATKERGETVGELEEEIEEEIEE